jgi:hypothetical protein
MDLPSSLASVLGFVFLASPFLLCWWIYGDYERYVWLISGPYPYDNLISIGFVLTGVAVRLRVVFLRTR